MALQIFIRISIAATLTVIVGGDVTVQYPPLPDRSNIPWTSAKMEHPSTMTFPPLANSYNHATTPNPHCNNYQHQFNYHQNNFDSFEKKENFEMMNHVYTTSGNYPVYSWPGRLGGSTLALPQEQKFNHASQYWPSYSRIANKQYQPLDYVSPVAKIEPPKGYKLWSNQY